MAQEIENAILSGEENSYCLTVRLKKKKRFCINSQQLFQPSLLEHRRGWGLALSNVVFVHSPDFLQLISNPELGPSSKFYFEDYRQQTSVNQRGPDRDGGCQLLCTKWGARICGKLVFEGQKVGLPLLRERQKARTLGHRSGKQLFKIVSEFCSLAPSV